MKRNIFILVILALAVFLITSGFVAKIDFLTPAGGIPSSHAISISDTPLPLQIVVGLLVIFFGTLATAPLFLEGHDARQAGIFNHTHSHYRASLSKGLWELPWYPPYMGVERQGSRVK